MPTYFGRGKALVSAPTTTGGTWASTANLIDGNANVINNTLATWTSTTNGGTATFIVGSFTSPGAIGQGESLLTLGCVVRHGFSNAARIASVTAQAMDNGVNIGSPVAFNISTAQTSDKVILPVTDAQLRSPTFQIKVVATRKTVTQSCVWSVDFVDIEIDTELPAVKIDTITDTFDTYDAAKWDTANQWGTVAVESGQLKLTPGTVTYAGVYTLGYYDLRETAAYIKVTTPTPTDPERETSFVLSNLAVTFTTGLYVSGDQLIMRVRQSSVDNDTLVTWTADMVWWRISLTGTTMKWDTSPDGTTWTNRRTATVALAADWTNLRVELSSGAYGTGAPVVPAYYDNLNIVPSVPVGGKPKVYVGGSWQPKPVKVYLAGSWQEKPMKRWDGSQWKPV